MIAVSLPLNLTPMAVVSPALNVILAKPFLRRSQPTGSQVSDYRAQSWPAVPSDGTAQANSLHRRALQKQGAFNDRIR